MLTQLSARTGELAHLGQGVGARPRDDGRALLISSRITVSGAFATAS